MHIFNRVSKMINRVWSYFLFLLVLLVIITSVYTRYLTVESRPVQKLIIDTDAGGDDAVAILLVLSSQMRYNNSFEVVAITCTYGNTYEKNVQTNVRKILTVAEQSQIKVYPGAQKPLVDDYFFDNYFGEDGFGDFDFGRNITATVDRSKHASLALVDLAKKYKGYLSVLVLGPLTNMALACKLDPDFVKNVNTFYVMGGSVHGLGNTRPGVEYNFHLDPVSNAIFFNSIKKPGGIVLSPWETVINLRISKEWRRNILGSVNSTYVEFLNKVEAKSQRKATQYTPADAVAAATMLRPGLVTRQILVHVNAVMCGEARGSLLIDYANNTRQIANTRIVDEVAKNEFLDMLVHYLR